MFRFEYDAVSGIVISVTGGYWTPSEAQRYVAAFRRQVEVTRARNGRVRILIDGMHAAAQSPEVIREIQLANNTIMTDPDDRCAVVVASSLIKNQITQTLTHTGVKHFVSREAAMTWLTAYDRLAA